VKKKVQKKEEREVGKATEFIEKSMTENEPENRIR